MVSKKVIKAYDFETIEDYFDYILKSNINGQHTQVKSLIKAMSKDQKKECLLYFNNDCFLGDENLEDCKTVLIAEL